MADQNPLMTVLIGVLSGGLTAAVFNYYSSSEIEEQKFIYNVVAKALEVSSVKEREERLRFLLEAGFISESQIREKLQAKLDSAQTDPAALPQLRPRLSAAVVAAYADKKADPQLCTKYSKISGELKSVGDLESSRNYSKLAEKYCAGLNSP